MSEGKSTKASFTFISKVSHCLEVRTTKLVQYTFICFLTFVLQQTSRSDGPVVGVDRERYPRMVHHPNHSVCHLSRTCYHQGCQRYLERYWCYPLYIVVRSLCVGSTVILW